MVQAKYVIYQVKTIPAPELKIDTEYVNFFVASTETNMEKFRKDFSIILADKYRIIGCITPGFENIEILFTEKSDV